jgi:hypothetical protein
MVDVIMALPTYRYLLAINGCQIQRKTPDSFPSFSDMPHMVHLYVLLIVAYCTAIQQSGLGSSRSPQGFSVQVSCGSPGFLYLFQGLVEEANFSAIGFLEGEILTIFLEDLTHRRSFLSGQGFRQGVLEYVSGIVQGGHILCQLVIVIPASYQGIVMFDDVIHGLIDEAVHARRLTVLHVLLQLLG